MSYFFLTKSYSYWFIFGNTLVTISYSPDCVKTNCPLCTHTSACVRLPVRFHFCKWANRCCSESPLWYHNGLFNTEKSLKLLCLCPSGLIALDSGSVSKSRKDFQQFQPTGIDSQHRSGNWQCLRKRLTVRMACLPFCRDSRMLFRHFIHNVTISGLYPAW